MGVVESNREQHSRFHLSPGRTHESLESLNSMSLSVKRRCSDVCVSSRRFAQASHRAQHTVT